jgi:hypothetical protein
MCEQGRIAGERFQLSAATKGYLMIESIVRAVLALLSGVGALWLKRQPRRRNGIYDALSVDRDAGATGDWGGDGWDDPHCRGPRFPVFWRIWVEKVNRALKGLSIIAYPNEPAAEFDLVGSFLYGTFCFFLYKTREPATVRFGCILAQLGMTPDTMTGVFIGCSPRNPSKPLVCGRVELHRLPAQA